MKFLPTLLSITAFAFLTACGSGGGGSIDPTQADIQAKIFNQSCAVGGCHDSTLAGGLDLRAAAVPGSLVGVEAERSALNLIEAGSPDASFLVKKIEGDLSPSEGDQMPSGSIKLSNAKIQAVRAWIAGL